MKTIFNELAILENVMEGGITLKIFDFDGTLFNSPVPNPILWDNKTIGKISGDHKHGGYGWYQNPISLDDKYIDKNDFNEYVARLVEKSMEETNTKTILLTGRSIEHGKQIKKILDNRGLFFDDYGFKNGNMTTMEFKENFIKSLIEKYKATRIEIWDDRSKYIPRFEKFLKIMQEQYPFLKDYEVHYVKATDKHMRDTETEKQIVYMLVNEKQKYDNENPVNIVIPEKKPVFWAAMLYPESHGKLLEVFNKDIPEDWNIYAHHMTIAFGRLKTDAVKEYIDKNFGKDVELTATEIGKSSDAMAVKIKSNVPSDNNIPHMTIATPPNGKPYKSNFITEWQPLVTPIKLKAKISAEYK